MAIVLEDEVLVGRPVEDVFAFTSNHENLPRWTVGVVRSKRTSDGGPGLGATYALRGKAPGGEVDASYRVTAWGPPRRFEGHCESKLFEFDETYTFEQKGD
ncbi:MAG TPA: SRPBCC family protein, partial [Polyangiaceae bacterium]|nr:SRPBCC family protein [Polyangiaceae bacterium]